MISEEGLKKYREIVMRLYGIELSPEEARVGAEVFIHSYEAVFKPSKVSVI
jgi:hypothetical protein